ncbi:MAG: hypothetical protein RMZ69_21780 [Nostoc sp. ChiQUE01a]|nr:hypothetical protein [Nostoc sp. ChiQUE01a]
MQQFNCYLENWIGRKIYERIYIDNFRGLVNFEMNFDSINLFLGGNGTG